MEQMLTVTPNTSTGIVSNASTPAKILISVASSFFTVSHSLRPLMCSDKLLRLLRAYTERSLQHTITAATYAPCSPPPPQMHPALHHHHKCTLHTTTAMHAPSLQHHARIPQSSCEAGPVVELSALAQPQPPESRPLGARAAPCHIHFLSSCKKLTAARHYLSTLRLAASSRPILPLATH